MPLGDICLAQSTQRTKRGAAAALTRGGLGREGAGSESDDGWGDDMDDLDDGMPGGVLSGSAASKYQVGSARPRTIWTRRAPHPVRIGHAASVLNSRASSLYALSILFARAVAVPPASPSPP